MILNEQIPLLKKGSSGTCAYCFKYTKLRKWFRYKRKKSIAYLGIGINNGNTISSSLVKDYNADVFFILVIKMKHQKPIHFFQALVSKYDEVIIRYT